MSKYTKIKQKEIKTIGNVVKEDVNGVIRDVRYIPEGIYMHYNPMDQMISTLLTNNQEEEYEKPLWD